MLYGQVRDRAGKRGILASSEPGVLNVYALCAGSGLHP